MRRNISLTKLAYATAAWPLIIAPRGNYKFKSFTLRALEKLPSTELFFNVSSFIITTHKVGNLIIIVFNYRVAFDEDRVPNLYDDKAVLQDIHSVSSLLKMYFRELPNPVCTYHLYEKFVEAAKAPENQRLVLMRDVVQQLPPPYYRYVGRNLVKSFKNTWNRS